MSGVPSELVQAVEKLDQSFWVSREKLKAICDRFQKELEEGLEENGRNIPMNITWVQGLPSGEETGSFLTVDLGGTNIRICWITLTGGGAEPDVKQHSYKVDDNLKTETADELWDFVAGALKDFIHDQNLGGSEATPLPLGFTFSYPATQDRIDHGILQTWTKGFDIKGVEGEDAAAQLKSAMTKRVSTHNRLQSSLMAAETARQTCRARQRYDRRVDCFQL